jgi:UDP-N-acetylglucosamine 2-epimerase (non-hydrolysing)
MTKRIAIVLGTRPEAIKLIPVYLEFRKTNADVCLVSTGQHQSMLEQIFNFFDVKPDLCLDVMLPSQTLAGLTARLTETLQKCFTEHHFDIVVVQGDTTTAMVASLVSFYNGIKVAHVEAGLRTYHKFSPFPEEINRQIIGRIADFHFAPTQRAADILIKEGLDHVYCVGNTVIDSLLLCLEKVRNNEAVYQQQFDMIHRFQKLILITGHRRENFGEGFEQICAAIKELAALYPNFLFYYPVHLNPNVKQKVYTLLSGLPNVFLGNPLPYDELVFLMSQSFLILTDSGGIQEEAPTLNVPLLVMRDTTERSEGIDAGCALLVGTSTENIVAAFTRLVEYPEKYRKMVKAENPYGDGSSSERIVRELLK